MADISIFDTFAKGKKSIQKISGTNCVIYTRVSSKEQSENLSLSTQLKACNHYAERANYNVVAKFGGTYESAETDERKEFSAMITYVRKSKEKISYILVYSLERFSRNDNSIWLSGELRKLGIEIVSVTQPIDTSNASGQMQQKMLFLFGEFDNQLRKQKCMAGIKDMLLGGDWPTMPPLGYSIVRRDGKRSIVVNEKGKLLKLAFEWKADLSVTNEEIRLRLDKRGLKLNHQRISEIFRNPFYCGLMAHNMLEGKVVPGNHEKLISKTIFLKVNGLLDKNTQGYTINEENEAIPLKRFLLCDHCEKPLRGYMVRKKGIYYYKCNTVGCGNNKNARELNHRFRNILQAMNLDGPEELREVIKANAIITFNKMTKGDEDACQLLRIEYKKVTDKIERLEERYVEEEITSEMFNKFIVKYSAEKEDLEGKINALPKEVSNLDQCVEMTMDFATKMASRWDSADYLTKQEIQYLVFPDGIKYNRKNDNCRTTRINSFFLYAAYLQQLMTKKKRGIPELSLNYASFADLVASTGIEPVSKV